MHDYLDNFPMQDLLYGLNYLSQASIKPQQLPLTLKVRVFHGEQDRISPIEDALKIKPLLPGMDFFSLKQAGHIVFLNPEFKKFF